MAEPLNIQIQTVPTEEAIRRPPVYVNSCQIVGDANGHTLYLFATPPDAIQLAAVRSKVGAPQQPGAAIQFEMEPVAKVFLSPTFMGQLVQVLATQMRNSQELRAAFERLAKGGTQ